MAIEQRDVYLIPPPFNNRLENHPFIVLSLKEANEYEGTFVCVMITSSNEFKDDYSFLLEDQMFDHALKKEGCHARMHLLTLCLNQEVIGERINRMKPFYFKELMKSIGDLVFNYNFEPLTN
jgi:hypothetical protein